MKRINTYISNMKPTTKTFIGGVVIGGVVVAFIDLIIYGNIIISACL